MGAITDLVQDAFGPVDLDRSPVELGVAPRRAPGCPACRGRRFGFPADLVDAARAMCRPHRQAASKVSDERLGRADASNPEGWSAIGRACARLSLPHLPNGLATRLAGAEGAMFVVPEPGELASRAGAVVEAAESFPGRPGDLAVALGAEEGETWLPDWLRSLVLDLGRAGLGAEAVAVAEALARVDPVNEDDYSGDAAIALATAGDAAGARARIGANLARWPRDLWAHVAAGEALQALGDTDGAEAHFRKALDLADDLDDFEASSTVAEHLTELGRPPGPRTRLRVVPLRPARGPRDRSGTSPGRNDPCHCGSGRKYKHCHGRR